MELKEILEDYFTLNNIDITLTDYTVYIKDAHLKQISQVFPSIQLNEVYGKKYLGKYFKTVFYLCLNNNTPVLKFKKQLTSNWHKNKRGIVNFGGKTLIWVEEIKINEKTKEDELLIDELKAEGEKFKKQIEKLW